MCHDCGSENVTTSKNSYGMVKVSGVYSIHIGYKLINLKKGRWEGEKRVEEGGKRMGGGCGEVNYIRPARHAVSISISIPISIIISI